MYMEYNNFTKQDIPYKILEEYGLTRQMINDLPKNVMNMLLTGRITPPLPVKDMTQEGEETFSMAKISLIRKEDGSIDVLFRPRMEILDIDSLPSISEETIRSGKVVRTDKGYAQYNDAIEQLIQAPYGIVLHNIETLQVSAGLSQKDRDDLLKGKPVTIREGEYKGCTVGIDLENDKVIRLSKGTVQDWEKEESIDNMKKYNFGISGCWVCDERNTLQYVEYNDYENHPDIMEAFEQQNTRQTKIK